ncbi:preprotein translocase subunit SecG [Pelagibacterium lacus]|uniref:Protein-export membrane protein SecG n=1 Tax=Pelagibacterium lacus TaxID=2282655 RepID=A0A369W1S4_9HYPH|nr:preprotein translocase subunit SecG [Pelagibacterium lacus]RDE07979.1 preprotein translocase subunit SecG [Pelagibacterium lacus]
MATVLIVAYLLIVIAMIIVILLQRSEGGGLGMGGGGNFMSARGSANLLTRTTAILGTLFMVTAIGLTIISQTDRSSTSILDQAAQNPDGSRATVLDALDALGTGGDSDLNVPAQPAGAQDDLTPPAADPEAAPADLAVPAETAPEAPAEQEPAQPDAAPAEETEPEAPATSTTGN